MKKGLLILGITGTIALAGTGAGVCAYNKANAFELKSDEVEIRLGDTLSENISDYIDGGKKALAGATLDISRVDTEKVGTYNAYVSYGDKELFFSVKVCDHTVPNLKLKQDGNFTVVAGQTISLDEIVDELYDLGGVASISLKMVHNGEEVEIYPKDQIDKMKLYNDIDKRLAEITFTCEEEGGYRYEIDVADQSHNLNGTSFDVHVVEDYAQHISGFHDWTVEQNAEIDFTKGIEADERIASVTAGDIDLSKTGEHTLVYSITGDDNETVIEHSVKVTVVDASTAQKMANNGETIYVSGNGTKAKEVKNLASSNGSNKSKTGSKSGSTSSSTNSASNADSSSDTHFYDSWEEGTTFELGDIISSTPIESGGTGYSYEPTIIDENGNIIN